MKGRTDLLLLVFLPIVLLNLIITVFIAKACDTWIALSRLYPVLWTHQKVCILQQTNGGVSWTLYNEESMTLNSKWKPYGSF